MSRAIAIVLLLCGMARAQFAALPVVQVLENMPYDAEVEYLESTGTQYIDTGLVTSTDKVCNFDLKGAFVSSAASGGLFGWRYGATARYGWWQSAIGLDNSTQVPLALGETIHEISARNGAYVEVDSVQTPIGTASIRDYMGIVLFANVGTSYGSTPTYFASGKICYFRAYNTDDEILVDFIPVRVGIIGYMYDKVSCKLYGNAGTGAFVLGPDK